ncbi:hypothetical protein AYJ54_07925 [Bradyrhizobium centrolobii]|uniref:Uncharacterized protein n=1 Tax=Bradyrhizobium centrolobii TaxID=1505087 RepID=A0A176YVN6_9BRAD|nr:hypothetical protein [Bradyrhizobium centrolobii]OAF11779.1 hypothetical protein AYJ54_07925 [Bradyrhizobium centrolobii]
MATAKDRRITLEASAFPGAAKVVMPGGETTIERGYGSALSKASAATLGKFAAADALIAAEQAVNDARSTGASAATIAKLVAAFNSADSAASGQGV